MMKPARSPADLVLVKIAIFFQIKLDAIWMAVVQIIYFLLELIGNSEVRRVHHRAPRTPELLTD